MCKAGNAPKNQLVFLLKGATQPVGSHPAEKRHMVSGDCREKSPVSILQGRSGSRWRKKSGPCQPRASREEEGREKGPLLSYLIPQLQGIQSRLSRNSLSVLGSVCNSADKFNFHRKHRESFMAKTTGKNVQEG